MILALLLFYFHLTFFKWGEDYVLRLCSFGQASGLALPFWLFDRPPTYGLDEAFVRGLLHALDLLAVLATLATCWSCLGPVLVLGLLFGIKLLFYTSELMLLANYDHFHLLLTGLFLISTSRLFFMRVGLVVLYVLAALPKLSSSWFLGEYFTSIPGKLPLMPQWDWFVTLGCWWVVALELFGGLLWFAPWRWVRLAAVGNFLLFHLYSGVIVGFRYTTLMLPLLCATFWNFDRPLGAGYRFSRRHLGSWLLLAGALGCGLIPMLIPGDSRLTGEGRYLGCFMYDAHRRVHFRSEVVKGANRFVITVERGWQGRTEFGNFICETHVRAQTWRSGQLVSDEELTRPLRDGGTVIIHPIPFLRSNARAIGDPYMYWRWARSLCERYRPDRVSLQFSQWLDGHPEEHRVLDIPDFVQLNPSYNPIGRNPWIIDPSQGTN